MSNNLYKLDKFLAESLDKKFLSSATVIEGINKTIYKIQSGTTELILHVKEKEALIQNSNDTETLFHISSEGLSNVLPRLVSQAVSKPKTYKTPFGLYSNVVIAPVERHRVVVSSSQVEGDSEFYSSEFNWEAYRDAFAIVYMGGSYALLMIFEGEWVMIGVTDSEDKAKSMADQLIEDVQASRTEITGEEDIFQNTMPDLVSRYIKNPSIENIPVMESVVFEDSNKNRWIVSQEEARITLGLYDLLVDSTSEHAILLMPSLYPSKSPKVSIQSQRSSFEVREEILSSYFLMSSPKSIPSIGTVSSLVNIVSSVDEEKIKKNSKAINSFYRKKEIVLSNYEELFKTSIGKQASEEELIQLIEEAEAVNSLKPFLQVNNHSGFTYDQLKDFYTKVHSIVKTPKNIKSDREEAESTYVGRSSAGWDLDKELQETLNYDTIDDYVDFKKNDVPMSRFTNEQLSAFYKAARMNSKVSVKKKIQSNKEEVKEEVKDKESKKEEEEDINYMANFFRVSTANKKKLVDTYVVKRKFDPEDIEMYTENQQEALKSVKNKLDLTTILELGTGLC